MAGRFFFATCVAVGVVLALNSILTMSSADQANNPFEKSLATNNKRFDLATLTHEAWKQAEWKEHEPEAWAQRPHDEWPRLLMRNRIKFKHSDWIETGWVFFLELDDGQTVAVTTADTLLQFPGKLIEDLEALWDEWIVYCPHATDVSIPTAGLFSKVPYYTEFDGVPRVRSIFLKPASGPDPLPVAALKFRSCPPEKGERIYLVGSTGGEDSRQRIFPGIALSSTREVVHAKLDSHDGSINGLDGAPVVDEWGHLVGSFRNLNMGPETILVDTVKKDFVGIAPELFLKKANNFGEERQPHEGNR